MKPPPPDAAAAPAIRHLVWDWNGTLLDDVQASVNALNRLLTARRLPPIQLADYRERFGFPVRDYYRELGFDLARENWDQLARDYHDYFLADAAIRVRPEARAVLEQCQAAGFGLSVLSAAEQTILDNMLAAADLRRFFTFVHGVDNLDGHSKSDAGQRLFARLTCPPASVLLIGDTLHDYEVATALGCACLLIAQGHQSRARLLTTGCAVLARLRDVPPFLANIRHFHPGTTHASNHRAHPKQH